MKKRTALKSIGVLCIIHMVLSCLLPLEFHILLRMIIIILCLLLLVLTRLNWRKKYMEYRNLKNSPEGLSTWRTGIEEIDELFISGIYWAIALLVVPMFDIPIWILDFKHFLLSVTPRPT